MKKPDIYGNDEAIIGNVIRQCAHEIIERNVFFAKIK